MKKRVSLRRIFQIAVFGLLLYLSTRHMNLGIEKAASIDAYCPFGAMESFFTYITTGEFLKRIYISTFTIMAVLLVATLLFGRVFCSHFCPLGALQEWIRMLGKKIGFKKNLELPQKLDAVLRYLKYIILIFILYFSFKTGDLIFRGYDPFNALMHLGEEFDEKIAGYSILLGIVVISLFTKSWWCRYLCPFGAGLGIIRKLSPFHIKRDKSSCVGCGSCNKVCPANLNIATSDAIKSAECISCVDCISDCPKSSLKADILGKYLSKKWFSLVAVLIFFVPLLVFSLTPAWQTKAPSNIVKTDGSVDVANLRGSNTLKHVIEITGLPYSYFQQQLGLPEKIDMNLKLKDIGPTYNIKKDDGTYLEMEDIRAIVEKGME